jgi:hypothetical protein
MLLRSASLKDMYDVPTDFFSCRDTGTIITKTENAIGTGTVLIVRIITRVDRGAMMTVTAIGTETESTESIAPEMIVNVTLSGIETSTGTGTERGTEKGIETGTGTRGGIEMETEIDIGIDQERKKRRREKRL